jgi:tripartite-type tricarboxylate transporter receptor subunit TctC
VRTALASQAVLDRFKALGAEATPSTPEEFRELSRRETAKWAQVVKFSGAKLD